MMSKKYIYLIAFLIFGIFIVGLFLSTPSSNSGCNEGESADQKTRDSSAQTPFAKKQHIQTKEVHSQGRLERMKDLIRRDYNTPIDFWGKVLDQNGNPLAGAKVEIVIDGFANRKKHVVFSDKKGLFELLGKRGARARVKVFLEGYAPTFNEEIGSNISARTIYYADKAMPAYAPPTKDNPQVFVLRKKNPTAHLAYAKKKHVSVKKTGIAQKINLKVNGKNITVQIRCWSSCPVPFTYDKYDWRAEIKIARAKLQPITQHEAVSAPADGYQPIFKVEMSKNTERNWLRSSPNGTRDFWIQFDDGTYAKAHIEIKTGRKHEVDAEIWYNLDGTNNFEQ